MSRPLEEEKSKNIGNLIIGVLGVGFEYLGYRFLVGNICHSSKLQTSWQFGCRRDCFNFLFADAFVAPGREIYSQNFIEGNKLVSSCGKKDVLRRFATKSYELSNIWLHNPFPTKSSYMDCQSRFVHVGLFKMDSMLSG